MQPRLAPRFQKMIPEDGQFLGLPQLLERITAPQRAFQMGVQDPRRAGKIMRRAGFGDLFGGGQGPGAGGHGVGGGPGVRRPMIPEAGTPLAGPAPIRNPRSAIRDPQRHPFSVGGAPAPAGSVFAAGTTLAAPAAAGPSSFPRETEPLPELADDGMVSALGEGGGGGRGKGKKKKGKGGRGMKRLLREVIRERLATGREMMPHIRESIGTLREQAGQSQFDDETRASFLAPRMEQVTELFDRAGQRMERNLAQRGLTDSSAYSAGVGALEAGEARAKSNLVADLQLKEREFQLQAQEALRNYVAAIRSGDMNAAMQSAFALAQLKQDQKQFRAQLALQRDQLEASQDSGGSGFGSMLGAIGGILGGIKF